MGVVNSKMPANLQDEAHFSDMIFKVRLMHTRIVCKTLYLLRCRSESKKEEFYVSIEFF